MQQTGQLDGVSRLRAVQAAPRKRGLPNLLTALAAATLSLARRPFERRQLMLPPALTGFVHGDAVRLPPGEVIAAEWVEHPRNGLDEEVVATGAEAWIAVRLGRNSIWYAFWHADEARWELLGG